MSLSSLVISIAAHTAPAATMPSMTIPSPLLPASLLAPRILAPARPTFEARATDSEEAAEVACTAEAGAANAGVVAMINAVAARAAIFRDFMNNAPFGLLPKADNGKAGGLFLAPAT